MTDFWSFLLQTLTASGVAALLLIVKALFRDKLSPRWQFAVWGVLGVILLFPAGMRGGILCSTGRFMWSCCVLPSRGSTAPWRG